MKTEHTSWYWLAGFMFVALGCAFEYLFFAGLERFCKRVARKLTGGKE